MLRCWKTVLCGLWVSGSAKIPLVVCPPTGTTPYYSRNLLSSHAQNPKLQRFAVIALIGTLGRHLSWEIQGTEKAVIWVLVGYNVTVLL